MTKTKTEPRPLIFGEETEARIAPVISTLCDIYGCRPDETLARNLGLGNLDILTKVLETDSRESLLGFFIHSRILGLNKAGNPVPDHLTVYSGIPETVAAMIRMLHILRIEGMSVADFGTPEHEPGSFRKDFLTMVEHEYLEFDYPQTSARP